MYHQFKVYRLSSLDLHALWFIARADQAVHPRWYVEIDKARAISSSRSYDTPIACIQNGHLVPTQSGVWLGQFLDESARHSLHRNLTIGGGGMLLLVAAS